MTPEQEKKWRDEALGGSVKYIEECRENQHAVATLYCEADFQAGYLAARKTSQVEIDLLTQARDEWRGYTFDERGKLKDRDQEIERLKKEVEDVKSKKMIEFMSGASEQLKERDELIKEAIEIFIENDEAGYYTQIREWIKKARKMMEEKCFY